MIRNVLIISSNFTGHGHKSITDSLCEQFKKIPDINVSVVDGFSLGGTFSLSVGKMYGSVTRNAKELWKLMWDVSQKKPDLICEITEIAIKKSFLGLLARVKPDLILSVHPNFNGSVLNILQEYDIKILFVTLIADLVSISPLWADSRADFTICPTQESKERCLEYGVPEERLKVIGFPIRAKFCRVREYTTDRYTAKGSMECLIMSGGEGSGNMGRIARVLLDNFNCRVKIVAGRNAILRKQLEKSLLEKYQGRFEVFGFVEDIQELMLTSDIAFTRGSPNTMLEVVNCNVPLIITGNLPGQEEGNPEYLMKHNLGVVCKSIRKLKSTINSLLAENGKRLNEIKRSQRNFVSHHIAGEITDFLLGIDAKTLKEVSPDIINIEAS